MSILSAGFHPRGLALIKIVESQVPLLVVASLDLVSAIKAILNHQASLFVG
jgi:hypothetical protein